MAKCNVENMRLFVEALRSGTYVQGWSELRTPVHDSESKLTGHRYCCLGVATDVAIAAGVPQDYTYEEHYWEEGPTTGLVNMNVWEEEDEQLSEPVRDWLGIESCNPDLVDEDGVVHSAIFWNDEMGASLPRIGDMFERKYLTQEEGSPIG